MKKRKKQNWEKPRMCDPGMCGKCRYIGDGDFICTVDPSKPVIVVESWQPNENTGYCRSLHRKR
jgi:hypothetical protein